VEPWGRRYVFAEGPLPERIVSQGEDLLASPASILIEIDGAGPVTWGPVELLKAEPAVVRLRSRLEGPVQGQGLVTIEYDGMIRVDLAFVPSRGLRLRRVQYEVELARGVGRWFNRHVPYSYESLNVDKQLLLSSAGVLPEGRLGFEFTPTVFVGNRQVGIEWWGETNAHWIYPSGGEPIEIVRSGADSTIRVAPVEQPVLTGPEGWSDHFALFPAPMRPARGDWRSTRFVVWRAAKRFAAPWARYFWISFPAHFRPKWHGLPSSDGSGEQEEIRSRVRSAGVGFIPYGKLTAGPSYHPRTLEMRDEWSANAQAFTYPPRAERAVLQRNTNWKPRTPYSYAVCMRHTDYLSWILDENLTALRDEALDGLYFDFGSISRMCQRDPRVRTRGRDQAWNYFSLRQFYKSLYEQMQLVNPDAILTAHTHGQPKALSAYLDFNFVGEALNVVFRGGKSWRALLRAPRWFSRCPASPAGGRRHEPASRAEAGGGSRESVEAAAVSERAPLPGSGERHAHVVRQQRPR
jgi:hypothetical protein